MHHVVVLLVWCYLVPLELKYNTTPDQLEQKTPWHITFLHHPLTTKRNHSSPTQSEIGTVFLTILSIHYFLNNSGVMFLYKLYLRYSTSCSERESRPFCEEPETFISILISTAPMHLEPFVMHSALPARPQPLVRSLQLVEV